LRVVCSFEIEAFIPACLVQNLVELHENLLYVFESLNSLVVGSGWFVIVEVMLVFSDVFEHFRNFIDQLEIIRIDWGKW